MACATLGIKPSGMVCRAMKGLVEEASEHMQGLKPSSTTDAELIALAQKVEHYEIGSYGTLCRWAETMGHTEALDLLKKNLSDEERTDQLLTQVAESEVNQMAAHDSKQMMVDREKKAARGRRVATKRATSARGTTGRKPARATAGRSATGRKSTTRAATGRAAAGRPKASTERGKATTPRKTAGRPRVSAR